MPRFHQAVRRRKLLLGAAAALTASALPAAGSSALVPTPWQTAGPFYPDSLPADSDADLVRNDSLDDSARGEPLGLTGKLLGVDGQPLTRARIEIWQCDAGGRYLHSGDRRAKPRRDAGFQGFGAAETDGLGGFAFRTIRPAPYPGRTPHIHLRVLDREGRQRLVTQLYVAGEASNGRDGLYRSLTAAQAAQLDMKLKASSISGLAWETEIDLIVS